MTTIKLHGLLAKEYQDQFVLNIAKPQDVVRAIDSNRKGFLKRFNELKRQGFHYDIIVDRGHMSKKIKQVDLVPVIVGSGAIVGAIAGIFGGGALATAGATLAVGAGAAMLSKALKPKPEQRPDVGGTAATDTGPAASDEPVTFQSRAAVASMVFNNVANIASQGDPVPIGYGRLKIGSSVVQATIKSFPMSHKTSQAFNRNPFNVEGQEDVMQEIYSAGDE